MELVNISKVYHNKNQDKCVYRNISYKFDQTGFVLLYGESGCGKTTLLNIIAGIDTEYSGKVIREGKVEYLNQQIELIENLSVLENLNITISNRSDIIRRLEDFNLSYLKDRKVKYLSNGEKRRVQIIRSTLVHPDLLLCDEPTASLDYDNAKHVCDLLKKISSKICVIVTSHDLDLLNQYCDIILRVNETELVEEKRKSVIRSMDPLQNVEEYNIQKNFRDYIKACYLFLKAHISTFICVIFLLQIIFISLYSVIFYSDINKEELEKNKWYYSDNLIQLVSHDRKYYSDHERWINETWDSFTYEELDNIVSGEENIVAYNYQLDLYYNWLYFLKDENYDSFFSPFKHMKDGGMDFILHPSIPFVTLNDLNDMNNAIVDLSARAFLYEIIDENSFPLILGSYPIEEDEIIIGQDLANHLCEYWGFSDQKMLLNQILNINVDSNRTKINGTGLTLPSKIVGITSLENNFEKRIYFKKEAILNNYSRIYGYNYKDIKFNSIKFLVNPNVRAEEIAEKLNEQLPLKYGEFKVFDVTEDIVDSSEKSATINTTLVILTAIFITAIAFSGIIYVTFFFKKQKDKEDKILIKYGYNRMKYTNISNLLIISSAFFLNLLLSPLLIFSINQIFDKIIGKGLLQFNLIVLLGSIVLGGIIYWICMCIFTKLLSSKSERRDS